MPAHQPYLVQTKGSGNAQWGGMELDTDLDTRRDGGRATTELELDAARGMGRDTGRDTHTANKIRMSAPNKFIPYHAQPSDPAPFADTWNAHAVERRRK